MSDAAPISGGAPQSAAIPATARRAPLRIDADHPSLAGHFPGNPVVPGVVVLDAVAAFARECLAESACVAVPLARIPQVKFLAPLLPGNDAEIELLLDEAKCRARFRVLRGAAVIASGELTFAPP